MNSPSLPFPAMRSIEDLNARISLIHTACHTLCQKAFGQTLPVAGNIGVFCHEFKEYEVLQSIVSKNILPDDHWNHKYYRLRSPIIIPASSSIPQSIYTYLYIRPPDDSHKQAGDVDFVIPKDRMDALKQELSSHACAIPGLSLLEQRPDLDLLSLSDPSLPVLSLLGTRTITEQIEHTKQIPVSEQKYECDSFTKILTFLDSVHAQKLRHETSTHYYGVHDGTNVDKVVVHHDRIAIHRLSESNGRYTLTENCPVTSLSEGLSWLSSLGYTSISIVDMDYTEFAYRDGTISLYSLEGKYPSIILTYPKESLAQMETVAHLSRNKKISVPYPIWLRQKGVLRTMPIDTALTDTAR